MNEGYEGWILLSRKLLTWQWYDTAGMVHLWVHLLLSANIEDKKWHGIVVERGQFVTSVKRLSEETGLSVKQVRTGLARLQDGGEIFVKTTNKFSLVTICNYRSYQDYNPDEGQTKDKQTANEGQTKDKQTANEGQQLNNITIKQLNNLTNLLGTDVPLSPEGDGVSDTTPEIPEIPENGEKTDAADNTLTLTPPQPKKEKSCAKKEKAGADYKWDEIREWFNGTVASAPDCKIKKIQAFNDKRKETFRKAMRTFGRDKVAEAVRKAATVPFLNGDNDRHWVADFDFILNENKLPRILEAYYDHLHEKQPTTAKLTGSAYTLHETEKLLKRMENGNSTDTGTENFTLGEPADYIAVLGNL